MPLLQIDGVHKRYGRTEVLNDVSLTMDTGDIVSIIGASGSGKTTLLRCVNLLETFHQGHIRLDGEEIGYVMRGQRRVPGIGLVEAARLAAGIDQEILRRLHVA